LAALSAKTGRSLGVVTGKGRLGGWYRLPWPAAMLPWQPDGNTGALLVCRCRENIQRPIQLVRGAIFKPKLYPRFFSVGNALNFFKDFIENIWV